MTVENRVVVITGATGGLGRVATHEMAEKGAKLALIGRRMESLEQMAEEFSLDTERYLAVKADLTDPAAAESAVQAIVDKFGRMDIVLHLVGGWIGGDPVVDVDPQDVADMLQQHAWSTLHVAQKFIPRLVENQWGRFMVVSAPSASSPGAKGSPYAMGKAAQQALMLSLAQELKGTGVTSNIISVKAIDVEHARENAPTKRNASWATPEEITAAMLYLCSEDAKLVSGAVIPIYGAA